MAIENKTEYVIQCYIKLQPKAGTIDFWEEGWHDSPFGNVSKTPEEAKYKLEKHQEHQEHQEHSGYRVIKRSTLVEEEEIDLSKVEAKKPESGISFKEWAMKSF